jgi:hypothetical protein
VDRGRSPAAYPQQQQQQQALDGGVGGGDAQRKSFASYQRLATSPLRSPVSAGAGGFGGYNSGFNNGGAGDGEYYEGGGGGISALLR